MIREIIEELYKCNEENILFLKETATLGKMFYIDNVVIDIAASGIIGNDDHPNDPHFHVYFYLYDLLDRRTGEQKQSKDTLTIRIRLNKADYLIVGEMKNVIFLPRVILDALIAYLKEDSTNLGGEELGYNNWQQLVYWWNQGAEQKFSKRKFVVKYKNDSDMPNYSNLQTFSEEEFLLALREIGFIPEGHKYTFEMREFQE